MTAPTATITPERLERAIRTVAEALVEHDLPGLRYYIQKLKTERDRLLSEVDAVDVCATSFA
jgi:hypothetical protein